MSGGGSVQYKLTAIVRRPSLILRRRQRTHTTPPRHSKHALRKTVEMDRRRGTSPLVSSAVCAAFFLVVGTASAVPVQQPEDGTVTGATAGFGAVLWSVLDDCVGDTADAEPAMVCFKSKALTALDRALSKPTVTLVDGLALSVRSAKSLADPHAEQADRAALDSAKDPAHKNALLDDMLASRMDKLMTTRTIVVDGGQEGNYRVMSLQPWPIVMFFTKALISPLP